MNLQEHDSSWDAISLSLVVNFIPEPTDRGTLGPSFHIQLSYYKKKIGRMLQLAYRMLAPDGILFLAVGLQSSLKLQYLIYGGHSSHFPASPILAICHLNS